MDEPLLTCEAVLAETASHLQSVPIVLKMVASGLITIAFDLNDHLPHIAALTKRYQDRQPDLADLCLIRMSELNPRHSVITVDREDFRVYRRNRREMIPLICPPAVAGEPEAVHTYATLESGPSRLWPSARVGLANRVI